MYNYKYYINLYIYKTEKTEKNIEKQNIKKKERKPKQLHAEYANRTRTTSTPYIVLSRPYCSFPFASPYGAIELIVYSLVGTNALLPSAV